MARNNGIRKEFQALDADVWKWTSEEKEKNGYYPKKKMIQSFALKLYENAGFKSFKASAGWYHRWKKRYGLERELVDGGKLDDQYGRKASVLISEQFPIASFQGSLNNNTDHDHRKTHTNDKDMRPNKRKCCKYDKDFKNEVVEAAKKGNVSEVAARYRVHPSTVSVWIKDDLFQEGVSKIPLEKSNAESKNESGDILNGENEFIGWLRKNEKNNKEVSKSDVIAKIKSLYETSWSKEPHWFAKYCHRLLKGRNCSVRKIHYPSEFQKLVLNYAARTSQLKTALVFNIARKQLFNWIKCAETTSTNECSIKLLEWCKSQKLEPTSNMIRKKARDIFSRNSKTCFSYSWYYKWCSKHGIRVKRNCDEKIVEWILLAYDLNTDVSHHILRQKALEIYRKHSAGSFKASTGWLLKFCRRYMDLIRRIPPLNFPLPSSYEKEILSFLNRLKRTISENDVSCECFGVMDEVPLKLKLSSTVDKSDERKTLLRSCGLNNIQGSIILCCLSNGVILPPVVTLKDKETNTVLNDCHILYRSSDVLDETIILYWLDNIWFRYVKQPNVLLLDCFSLHTSRTVQQKFTQYNSYLTIIPGGCSSKLNPVTQFISPLLQDSIDNLCQKWYQENHFSWLDDSVSLSSGDILDWILEAFEHLKKNCTSVCTE